MASIFVAEAGVVLVREVEAGFESEGGGGGVWLTAELPEDRAVASGDFVDGAAVAGRNEAVTSRIFIVPGKSGSKTCAGGFGVVGCDGAVRRGRRDRERSIRRRLCWWQGLFFGTSSS